MLRVLEAADFLALGIPAREMLLDPVIPAQGSAMLFAPRGVGKTHVALSMAYAIASGGAVLRWRAPCPQPEGYVDGEMPARAMQERVAAIVEAGEAEPPEGLLRFVLADLHEDGLPDLATDGGQHAIEATLGEGPRATRPRAGTDPLSPRRTEVTMTDGNKPPPLRREVFIRRSPPPAEFKALGGSEDDEFNQGLANDALGTLWTAHSDAEQRGRQYRASAAALIGSGPRSELEGMLVAQMLGCHHAAMECFRRAMLREQSVEVRQANLNGAAKMTRAYAALLEALDRHRGKGQPQVVRVERVMVEAGGQAIVGAVSQRGGGTSRTEDRPHAKQLGHGPEPEVRRPDPQRQPVPVTGGGGEAALPDARRCQGQRSA